MERWKELNEYYCSSYLIQNQMVDVAREFRRGSRIDGLVNEHLCDAARTSICNSEFVRPVTAIGKRDGKLVSSVSGRVSKLPKGRRCRS